jgi:branched-chain amino acid aminotransferase
VTAKVWLNGAILDAAVATVPVSDHGFTVGDGVFETLKVVDGVPFATTRHLKRLRTSAEHLSLAIPPDDLLRSALAETVAANDAPVGRVRITLTGGPGPAGTERGDAEPTVLVVAGPGRSWPDTVPLATVPWPRNERSAVTGAKTTSYAENVVALARVRAAGADEALFLNTRGDLCEGTGSNIFVVIDGEILTPPLSSGCLAGVTRALVIEWCGVREADLATTVLATAEEVFITSSTRDIQAVHSVDDRSYPAPGPITTQARKTFAERSRADVDP